MLGLFAATLVVENKEVANPKTDVTINVNAFQWGWKFTYPGQDVVVIGQTTQDPEMVMPVNENVHINLTSSDVIHGFYVHAFNFSRYALPGVLNQFTFRRGQDRHLLRTVHAAVRPLPFAHVVPCKVVTEAQYDGVAARATTTRSRTPPRRPPRGSRRSSSRADEAGLKETADD